MTITISIKHTMGIGDAIQFTTIPENYFLSTGQKVIDGTNHWVFDNNPYIIRNPDEIQQKLSKLTYGWNYNPRYIPKSRSCYTSMAEQHTGNLNITPFVRHPRLYQFENYPIEKRRRILLQTQGRSHGKMPDYIIDHVIKKYKHLPLYHLCLPDHPDIGIPRLSTPTFWNMVEEISGCRMLIGLDSGPSWIACCYPDIVVKRLRMKPDLEQMKEWVPLDAKNIHAIWDDLQLHQVYNQSENDVGFTSSYRRI